MGATALSLLGLIVWVAVASLTLHGAPCSSPPARRGPWGPEVIVTLCVAFFGLGHLAGYWREPGERPRAGADQRPRSWRLRAAAILQGVLMAFLLLVVGLLGYETYALANMHINWPITYYVRCANEFAPLPTTAGACAVCFLLGQWLWYPRRGR